MPQKLHKHFQWVGVGIYLLALLMVSLCFRQYALRPLWMAWGIGTVLFFFGLTYLCYQQWKNIDSQSFARKVFWYALAIRAVYVGAILFYYYFQTGVSFEYGASDSWGYHRMACYLSDLAREGRFDELIGFLNTRTIGFSDQGYVLYLTTLYTCFGKNILGPRLLKALMSAFMCVSIYKLASRSLGEKTGKLAAVMAVFLPQFIHYTGTYMKETEMVFLATLALERMDNLFRSKRFTFWNILLPIVLTTLTFGFRATVGLALLASFATFIIFGPREMLSEKSRWVAIGVLAVVSSALLLTLGREVYYIAMINFGTGDALVEKYQAMGMPYAEYASYRYMAPGAFTLPLTNLVEVANANQKMMNGTYFIKNYLAFFAMWCLVAAIRQRRCHDFSLIGTYTLLYLFVVAFSFAFNSERYYQPLLPGMLIMAAYAMTHFKRKDFKFFYGYNILLMIAIVAWNYLKLAARGLC